MFEQSTQIIFNRSITSDIFLLGFMSTEIAAESHPGQFVMIKTGDTLDPLLRRPFSICGIRDSNTVMILYRVVGTGTSILSQKKEGDKLRIMGPLGNGFKMPEAQDTAILIAGGMGSAPLFFLANSLRKNKSELMTGFRNNEETVESDTIIESSIKQSIATNDGSRGYHGLVTDLLETYIRTEGRSPDSLKIYACGPFPMLKKTASIAAMHHIFCQVSLESHMACGLGACQGCAVKTIIPESASPYRHVCLNGPVFLSTDIDWNDL